MKAHIRQARSISLTRDNDPITDSLQIKLINKSNAFMGKQNIVHENEEIKFEPISGGRRLLNHPDRPLSVVDSSLLLGSPIKIKKIGNVDDNFAYYINEGYDKKKTIEVKENEETPISTFSKTEQMVRKWIIYNFGLQVTTQSGNIPRIRRSIPDLEWDEESTNTTWTEEVESTLSVITKLTNEVIKRINCILLNNLLINETWNDPRFKAH